MSRDIAQRIKKLSEQATKITARKVAALVLDLPSTARPDWAEALPDGRCVLLGFGDAGSRASVLADLKAGQKIGADRALVLEYTRTASAFIADAAAGHTLQPEPLAH